MEKQQPESLRRALAAFAPKLKHLLKQRGISEAELGRQLKRRGPSVATKTINNLANARFSSEIGNMAAIADYFGVPLWVMLVPNLPVEMIEGEPLARLDKMIRDYIACAPVNRKHVENVAAAHANIRHNAG